MGQFDSLIGKFLLSGLIFLALFSLVIIVQSDNGADQPAIQNEVFNESFSGLVTQVEESSVVAEERYDIFISEDPAVGFGSIVLFGIVSVGKGFSNMTFSLFSSIIRFPLTVLGIDPSIYSIILTWLIITLIIAAWLLYKFG